MKFFKIVLALILAIGLVAGSTLTVMAKPEEKAKDQKPEKVKLEIQRGEVTSINAAAGSFVIKNGDKELTITTDNATKYFKMNVPGNGVGVLRNQMQLKEKGQKGPKMNPGVGIGGENQALRRGGQQATFNDIAVGDKVAVQLKKDTSVANLVVIFEKPFANIKGTVTALDTTNKKITITPSGGTAVTLNYGDQTVFTLRGVTAVTVEQTAHAVYRVKDMMARNVNIQPVPPPTPTPTPTPTTTST